MDRFSPTWLILRAILVEAAVAEYIFLTDFAAN